MKNGEPQLNQDQYLQNQTVTSKRAVPDPDHVRQLSYQCVYLCRRCHPGGSGRVVRRRPDRWPISFRAGPIKIQHGLCRPLFFWQRAAQAFKELSLLKRLPLEPDSGAALKTYRGNLEFHDLAFFHPHTNGPMFESLNLRMGPGHVLVVIGGKRHRQNNPGKTDYPCCWNPKEEPSWLTASIFCNWHPPGGGSRSSYMPQEPGFINGSIRENLLLLNPDLEDTRLNEILRITDLKPFLDKTPKGLDTPISNNEKNFPLGIRRRLSLARALAGNGNLVVLDEPTDAMDKRGVEAVYAIMKHPCQIR